MPRVGSRHTATDRDLIAHWSDELAILERWIHDLRVAREAALAAGLLAEARELRRSIAGAEQDRDDLEGRLARCRGGAA